MVLRDKHHVLALADNHVIRERADVRDDEVEEVVRRMFESGPDGVRVMVDGQAIARAPRPPSTPHTDTTETGVALAHHMLWQGYERAAQTQAFLLDRMNAAAIDMNRRYFEELQKMRADYHTKLDNLDAIALETRMFEREVAFRHIADHHRALNRPPDEPWYVQLAKGVSHLATALGTDVIDPDPKGGRRE